MKRILLLFTILLTVQIGFAQEEVAIEQIINQRINKLIINPGWDVHMIHNEADSSCRVAIITAEDYAAFAYNVQLCNVKDSTLTILENTQLPQGTVVEIEGPMTFRKISLLDKAKADADDVVATHHEEGEDLFLGRNSSFHIRHYHNPTGYPIMSVWDHAQLTIDTISGEGNVLVKVYEGDFQYGTDLLKGKIKLCEYEDDTRGLNYRQKDTRIIKTKEVDGEMVTTDRYQIWEPTLMVNVSLGLQKMNSPKDANSPLLQDGTTSLRVSMDTYFRLSNRWSVSTGIMANTQWRSLCHQVKLENNELTVIDGQGDFQRNRLISTYIGIPVSLNYYLGKHQTESISLDCFVGRTGRGRLSTTIDPTKFFGFKNWKREEVDIFNPWKLEVGLSFNTQHLGVIHGVRVFTNLLPEYKPGVTTDKFRTVGVEIKL